MKKQLVVSVSALTGILLLAPGCGETTKTPEKTTLDAKEVASKDSAVPASTAASTSQALMIIDGKPVIYEADFEQYRNDIIDAQPEQGREQYRQLIAVIPGAMRNIFDSQVNEEIINKWISAQGIDKTAAFQKEEQDNLEKFKKINKRVLMIKKFQDAHPVQVSASDIKNFYEENKDKIAELMISAGGVAAKAVMFDKEADAKAFLESLKNKPEGFEKAAEDKKLSVKDLGSVNDKSYEVEGPLRTKILALKNFPALEIVKVSDTSFAVVKAVSKEEAKYIPFEQVQHEIEKMLKEQKATEGLKKKLDELKSEYKIEINEEYFANLNKKENGAPQGNSVPAMPKPSTVKGA